MTVTTLLAPEAAEPTFTITVQISVPEEHASPTAARLLRDLEALAKAYGLTGPVCAVSSRADASSPSVRPLRLVETTRSAADQTAPVRRLGRSGGAAPAAMLHADSRLLVVDGVTIHLTRREFDLLRFLCGHPRQVFNRAQLLRHVWGHDMVGGERTVDVHIRRLRSKLGACAPIIATVRCVGYRLNDDAPAEIVVFGH